MTVAKDEKLDWLPPGWKVEEKLENGRKVRHYINAKSGKRLHSKAAVLQYMKNERTKSHSPQSMNGLARESPKNDIVPEPNDSLEWLPPGWTVEVRTRKSGPKAGCIYRCYIDPSTGKTLYSKPEVLRHLKELQHSTPSIGSPNQTGPDKSDPGQEASQQPKAREAKSLILRSAGPVKHDNSDPGQEVPPIPKSREARSLILGSARPVRHDKSDPGQEVSQEPKSCEAKSSILRSAGPIRRDNSDPGQKVLQLPKSREARSLILGSTRLASHGVSDPGQEVSQEPKPREVKNLVLRSAGPIRHDNSDPGKKVPRLPKSREARSLILGAASPIMHEKSDPGQESLQESKSRETKSLILRSAGPVRHDNTDPVQDQPEPPKSRELRSLINGSAGTIKQNKSDPGQEVSQSPRSREVRSPSLASEVPARHDKSDSGQKVVQPPKSCEARSLIHGSASPVRHEKSDPGQEVLPEPNSCEANSLTPSSANPIKPDNLDPGQKVPQHPKSREGKSEPTKKKKVRVETVIDQGLPPGWIKEIRIKKSGNGVRKDAFYLNPGTGYVFRSRVEVLRYLETGKISRHAYKRRDSGENGLHSAEDTVSPSASDVKSVAEEATTNRKLFTGEANGEGSSGPNDTKARRSGVLTRRSVLPASGKEAKQNEETTAQISSISGHNEDIVDMNKQTLPEACDIDGSHNKDVPVDLKNELTGSERSKDLTKSGNRKPKRKRKERVVSRRSSKRLAGAEVAPVTSVVPVERVTRSASKKSEIGEAVPTSRSKQSESSPETPPAVNVGSQEEIFTASAHSKDQATREALRRIFGDEPANESKWSNVETQSVEAPSRKEDSSRVESPKDQTAEAPSVSYSAVDRTTKQPPREKSPLTAEQKGPEISKRQREHQDSQFSFPWSDPCIEFAFKTLTGALQLDDNLAINDYVQHQIRTSADTSKNIILSDEGPPGFCQASAPSQSKKQQQPTVSAVSRTQQFQPTDATSLKKSTFSPQSSSYFALSDEGPPGFCQSNAPSAVPRSQPTVAALQKTNIYTSQSRSYNQQHQMHTSALTSKSVALSDDAPPGFSLSGGPPLDAPKQQQPTKPAVPRPQPSHPNTFSSQIRDYTHYQVQSHSVTLLDGGPPGFCQTNASMQQQPTNPSLPRTRWTDPALRKTDIISPPNHSYSQHQIHTSLGSSTGISLSDERPPGFSQSNIPLQFDASRQHQPANSFSPRNLNNFQHQTTTSSDGNSSVALLDSGPPGFRPNDPPLPTHSVLSQIQVSQPTGNIFNPQSHVYVQHQIHPPGVTLPDVSPPGFSQHDLRLQVGTSSQQQASNSVGPHAQQSQPASSMFGPRSHN